MALMSGLKQFPWLSLSLFLFTCSIFGWFLFESTPSWTIWLFERVQSLGWSLSQATLSQILTLLEIGLSLVILLAFTSPIALVKFCFGRWLESDEKAIYSFLIWSFLIVVMICWLEHFIRFLILLASTVLARLDLQTAGYNEWQMLTILAITYLMGFGLGWLAFTVLG